MTAVTTIGDDRRWLTTAQAATRLRVQPATLYAYVSRGMIDSHRRPGGRGSLFDAADVARLAARARAGGRAAALEIVVGTQLTLLDPAGHLYYRGWDVVEGAAEAEFEEVAEWLWSGRVVPGSAREGSAREGSARGGSTDKGSAMKPPRWRPRDESLAVARAVSACLGDDAEPVDVIRTAVAAVAATDPLRHDRRPEAVVTTGRSLIATLVDCLPGEQAVGRRLADRLWPKLTTERANAGKCKALNAAMVLLADHELAASTLAARVAASAWADPYLVVSAGLGVIGGILHGGASKAASELLGRATPSSRGTSPRRAAEQAIGEVLARGELVPGFGHKVYLDADPRAGALAALVREAWPRHPVLRTAEAMAAVMAERGGPAANIDFALAQLTSAAGMRTGAGEAIFAIARIAGWLAHAIEEYPHRLRYRPRAAYEGPLPLT